MKIPVGRLAPGDQWDQVIFDRLFANTLYPTGLEFDDNYRGYPDTPGCVLVVPGRYWHDNVAAIDEALDAYEWVLFIRTGDEEDLFDVDQITHPNIKFWIQTPRVGRSYHSDVRFVPLGFTPHFTELPPEPPNKWLDVFLSAQNTHERRHEAFQALADYPGVTPTHGFTQGLLPEQYRATMVATKIAPCPSGAVSPDSFRVYEALEAHAIPIADDISPVYDSKGYWNTLFPDAPFPILVKYSDLAPEGWIDDLLAGWPANANRIVAWWIKTKRSLAHHLAEDLHDLGAL